MRSYVAVLQEAGATSLSAQVRAVESAIWARNQQMEDGGGGDLAVADTDSWYMVDVFPEMAIVRQGRVLLSVPYSFNAEGAVEFGEATPVEAVYQPITVQESNNVAPADGVAGAGGLEWEVEIIHPGLSKNGLYYRPEVLAAAIPLFEGMKVYYFDDDARGHKQDARMKQPRQMVGWIDGVRQREDGVILGTQHFLQGGAADVVRTQVTSAWRRQKKDLFGLSIDARGLTKDRLVEGRTVKDVQVIGHVLSTDIVLDPAAGGAFTRLVESSSAEAPGQPQHERNHVDKRQQLLRLLESRRPAALAGLDREKAGLAELIELATTEELQEAFAAGAGGQPIQAAGTGGAGGGAQPSPAEIALAGLHVRQALQESALPDFTQKRIRERFKGAAPTEEQIQAAVDEERAYLAVANPTRVVGLGGARQGAGVSTAVGAESIDRIQAGLERALGLEPENAELRTIAPLSLRGVYNEITLGQDPEVRGQLQESTAKEMLQENFTSATLPRVMANALHRLLTRDYAAVDYGENRIISMSGSATDFRAQEAVRIGYFSDIPEVNPENGAYQELAPFGEESTTYGVGQRGAQVTITRRMIINDDLGVVKKMVSRLGRAAKRTFARFVWEFYRSNAAVGDGTPWFTVAHGNLLSQPLDAAGLRAARNALFNQREPGANERLALRMHLLVVPIQLEDVATQLNTQGGLNNDNPWKGKFGANGENILVNPLLDDPNDWGVFADPADVDLVEIKFLNGQAEPELLIADNPTVGQMFTRDELQYRIRHEYGGAPTDHRGAVKSVVAAA